MKRAIVLIITVLFCVSLSAQKSRVKYNPKGTWRFENSAAPAGYSSGIIEIKYAKKKYSIQFSFSENKEKYEAEEVSFKKDSLQFSLDIQGMAMTCKSKFEQADKITGETFVMGTNVPFTLIRDRTKSKSKK